MNKKVAVITDTNSGMSMEDAEKLGVYLVAMPVIIDGEEYFEELTIDKEEFFYRLRGGADVSTTQPSPGEVIELWDKLLKEYDEIIHIPMSSGISGTCETAIALAQEYGGRVQVANNRRISVTMRQSVLEAKKMADEGKSAAWIREYLEKDGLESSIYVAVDTLKYLKKSGRVTAAGAAIGSVLNIKPVLQIQGGKLDAYRKVRGRKQSWNAMIDGVRSDIEGRFAGQKLTIRAAYSGEAEQGKEWQRTLQEAFPEYEIGLDSLSISVCCHTGDGAMGVGVMKDIL